MVVVVVVVWHGTVWFGMIWYAKKSNHPGVVVWYGLVGFGRVMCGVVCQKKNQIILILVFFSGKYYYPRAVLGCPRLWQLEGNKLPCKPMMDISCRVGVETVEW